MLASIDVFGDAENLTPPDNMLNGNPVGCQLSVESLCLLSQGLVPICLDGRQTVGIPFGYALITPVSQLLGFRGNCQTAFR